MLSINGTTAYNTANIEGRTFTDSNADVEKLKFDTQAISFNDVTNTTNIDSNLAVTGTSTFNDVTINGALVGDLDVSGNFGVTGDLLIYDKRATPKPYIFSTDTANHLKLTYQPATINYTILDCSFNNFGDSELYLRRTTHATNGIEIDNYANVADTKKLYLGGTSTGSQIFHTNATKTLQVEAGASNSTMRLRTNDAIGVPIDVTLTPNTVTIPQTLSIPSYGNVTNTLDTINAKLTDVSYDAGTDTTSVSGNASVTGTTNLLGNTTIGTLSYGLFFQRNGNQGLAGSTYSAYTQGTLEIWYKNVGTNANNQFIFGVQNSFLILLTSGNYLSTYDYGAGVARTTATRLIDGGWHHLALVFELGVTNGTKLYYDGAPVLTTTISATTPGDLFLGNNYTTPASSAGAVQGILDEARIWNVKRTDAEILANYKSVITSATGLTGSWLMNDLGSLSTANAVSGAPAFTYTVGQAIPIWTYGRQTATLNATGEINTTNIDALNLTLGPTTTYNQNIQLKMDGLFLLGNRASNNIAGRAMNIHDTNALINISRYSDGGQPGFELQNWNPSTNALRNTVLFLGGGSGATGDATLRVSGVNSYYTTPTLFSMQIPAEVLVANTFSITGNTPTFRIRNNVAGKFVDYLFNQSAGAYNGLVQAGDNVMVANGGAVDTNALTLCTYNSNSVGIRMNSTAMTIGGNTTFTANSNVNQSGTGIISQTGTGTNALKSTTFAGNVTINGTLDYDGEPKAYYPTMNLSEDLSFMGYTRSGLMPKCMNCDLATTNGYSSTNQNRNNVMMGIVKVFKGTTYTGVVGWYAGGSLPGVNDPSLRVALYNVGTSPTKIAENTSPQTITGSSLNWRAFPFSTTWTADATKWVCVMAVSTNFDILTQKLDLNTANWLYSSGGVGKIDLVACYYTGFAGTFPATFSATPIAYGSKFILGLY